MPGVNGQPFNPDENGQRRPQVARRARPWPRNIGNVVHPRMPRLGQRVPVRQVAEALGVPIPEPHVRVGLRQIPNVIPEVNVAQALREYEAQVLSNPEDDTPEDGIEYGPDERVALELLGLPAERADEEQNMDELPNLEPGRPRIVSVFSLAPYHRVFRRHFDRARRMCLDIEVVDTATEDYDRHDWSDNVDNHMTYFRGKRNFHTTLAMVKDEGFNFFEVPDVMFIHHRDGVVTYRENDPACGHHVELHYNNSQIVGFSFRRSRNVAMDVQ